MAKKTNSKNKKTYRESNKRAGEKTALEAVDNEVIDLDKEIIIGMKKPLNNEKVNNKNKKREKVQAKKKGKSQNRKITYREQKKKTSPKKHKIYTEKEIEQITKRRRLIESILKKVFIFAIVITAIVLFIMSPLFSITNIEVQNNDKITSQTILSLSGLQIGQNIFNISKKQISKAICEEPYIEDVSITRNLPSTIIVKIKERKATFMIEIGGAYAYINNQGYILEISPENIGVPILQGYVTEVDKIIPGNRLEVEDLKKLDTVLKIMESAKSNEIVDTITKINIENSNNYILILEGEGKTAYIGDATNINTRMLYLKEIIERQKGVNGEVFIDKDINTKKAVFREKV